MAETRGTSRNNVRYERALASLRTERSDATTGAPGLTTRNKKLLGTKKASLLAARTLRTGLLSLDY